MNLLRMGSLTLLILCLFAVSLHAQMAIILKQRDGVIAGVNNNKELVCKDHVTYILAKKNIAGKALKLKGKGAHILFYEANGKKYCVDLRSVEEPAFEIMTP